MVKKCSRANTAAITDQCLQRLRRLCIVPLCSFGTLYLATIAGTEPNKKKKKPLPVVVVRVWSITYHTSWLSPGILPFGSCRSDPEIDADNRSAVVWPQTTFLRLPAVFIHHLWKAHFGHEASVFDSAYQKTFTAPEWKLPGSGRTQIIQSRKPLAVSYNCYSESIFYAAGWLGGEQARRARRGVAVGWWWHVGQHD